jgi:hypothetical protein
MSGTFLICDSDNSGGDFIYRDQLTTPIINCANYSSVVLTFGNNYQYSWGSTFGDVDLRVNGGAWQNVAHYSTANVIQNTSINISAMADYQSSVEIRWKYYNAQADMWWAIDNVALNGTLVLNDDIAASSLDNPGVRMRLNAPYTPKVTVSNIGALTQTFNLNLTIRDSVSLIIYNQTITGIVLNASQSTQESFSPDFTPTVAGNYTFAATVQNPGDQNTANDVVSRVVGASPHYGNGGPDAFGHIWKDNTVPGGPAFNYIDISGTGTAVGSGDDAAFGPLPIGFAFPFYDSTYSNFYVNTNGLVTLRTSANSRFNYCPVPGSSAPDFWLSPFWGDLDVRSSDGGQMYYKYFDASIDYVVIQWKNFSFFGAYGSPMDMEVILYANGQIIFQYNVINNLPNSQGQLATVGIEKNSGDGLAFLCNDDRPGNELYSGLAIGWYPPTIIHDIAVVSIDSPTAPLVVSNANISFAAALTNNGSHRDTFNVYLDVRNSTPSTVFADTVILILASGASDAANFSNWSGAVPDNYTFTITAFIAGDENASNNMLGGSIKAVNFTSLPVNENFEGISFPPPGWTILDYSGTSSWAWDTGDYRSPTHSARVSYDWLHNTNDWLVLAPINMSTASSVSWQYYEAQSQWATHGLRHSLYVSTGDYFNPATATPIAVQTPADHTIQGFSGDPIIFDLSAYAGNARVWLAYRQENAQGPNTEYWFIDDIAIFNVANADVGPYSINTPRRGIVTGCDAPVAMSVKNFGLQSQTFNVRVTITGNTHGLVYDDTASLSNLAPNTLGSVALMVFTAPSADRYFMTVTTLLPGDENASNNVLSDSFYAATQILHTWDDDAANGSATPYPFDNSMIAVKFTPLDSNFTILGGNIFVNQYSPGLNNYAEWEWVKICPDLGGTPDVDNPFGTVNNLGAYFVPILIPVDIADTVVQNYGGDIWIVAKYLNGSNDFLSVATDNTNPDWRSYYNQGNTPPVWQQVTDVDYMMRIEILYRPCGQCEYLLGDINGDGNRMGADVTYGVRFFKGLGAQPPDSCFMDSTGAYLYVAGDVNGNCEFRGSDITRLVAFFKSTAQLSYCHFFPTTLPILREAKPNTPGEAGE